MCLQEIEGRLGNNGCRPGTFMNVAPRFSYADQRQLREHNEDAGQMCESEQPASACCTSLDYEAALWGPYLPNDDPFGSRSIAAFKEATDSSSLPW